MENLGFSNKSFSRSEGKGQAPQASENDNFFSIYFTVCRMEKIVPVRCNIVPVS